MQQEYQKTSANAGVNNANNSGNNSNGNNRLREEARLKAKKVV